MTAALEGGEWSAARPGRSLPPGKARYQLYRKAELAPSQFWKGGKSRPHRDSIPDRPARSSVAIPTELPGPEGIFVHDTMSACYQRPTFRTILGHLSSELTTKSVLNGQPYKCRYQRPSETSVVNRHSTRCHRITPFNLYIYIWYWIFIKCNWVETRWQQYSTHLHKSTQNNTMKQNT